MPQPFAEHRIVVVMPAYNAAKTLADTIRCIPHGVSRLILVDDGSQDETVELARSLLLGLGLVTACTLAFQVVFSRMMATVLSHHFSFLAVSLVLLGTGAGALLLYLLEIVLIQRFVLFLGFPTYALSVVLFALLIFTGLGSWISSRLPQLAPPWSPCWVPPSSSSPWAPSRSSPSFGR
jgi:Glycosyl transferase family 2